MIKGSKLTEENKLKISLAHKGKKLSEEHKDKIRQGNLGKKRSEETKKRISISKIGHSVSEETKLAVSNANIRNTYCVGRKYSDETIQKMKEAQKEEKHWNWQGGKSNRIYPKEWNDTLKQKIRNRDNNTCQICGTTTSKRKFDVHHIDYDITNSVHENLITLCLSCHIKTNYNRSFWIEHFRRMENK